VFHDGKAFFLLTTETFKGKLHDYQHRTVFAISNIHVIYTGMSGIIVLPSGYYGDTVSSLL